MLLPIIVNAQDTVRIKHSNYHKFVGIAPEGFTLVPNEVLEELKDFDTWKEFKNDEEWIEKSSKKYLKKK